MSWYLYLSMAGLTTLVTVSVGQSQGGCLNLVTMNALMIPGFGNYTERRLQVPKLLNDLSADVYCLQEYREACDMEALINEMAHGYDIITELNTDDAIQRNESKPACSQADVDYFTTTVRQCADRFSCWVVYQLDNEAGIECLIRNCDTELKAENLTASCFSCIYHNPKATFEDSINNCTVFSGSCGHNRNPSGLVILSKKTITNSDYKSYFPEHRMTIPRGFLEVYIQDIGKVVCTQLTYTLPRFLEYDSQFDHYYYQHAAEIEKLKTTSFGDELFLLGDFYMGRGNPERNIFAFYEDRYLSLLSSGYSDPYVDMLGKCTVCANTGVKLLVDHIFIKGQAFRVNAVKRALEDVKAVSSLGRYGVQVQVCPRNATA